MGKAGALNTLPEPYGDWCPPPATAGQGNKERPSKGFAAAFSMVRTIQQAADLGRAVGGDAADDAKTYAALAEALRAEFHQVFYDNTTSQYDNGVMITNVLPLALGNMTEERREATVRRLLNHISSKNGTWSGGIINNRYLFDVLHDSGNGDVALAMLKKRDYPSYGYMYFNDLEPAKECMWELPDGPFQGTGMNSRNHHMFSSVGHYLVTRIAGLSHNPTDRQFSAVVGTERQSTATLRTAEGEAIFSWSRTSNTLDVRVHVPEGMHAHLLVPVSDGPVQKQVDVGHELLFKEVTLHHKKFNKVVLQAGTHSFSSQRAEVTVV